MKAKKLLSLLAALAMAISCTGITAFADEAVTSLSGAGTETEPYTISSAAELAYFRDQVNAGNTTYDASGVYVSLTQDISLDDVKWEPIGPNGDAATRFSGVFDGKGYTISDLYIKQGAAYHAAGLFGAIDGTVKNLKIENADITNISAGNSSGATVNGTAAVVGCMPYGGTIENVSVNNATISANRMVAGIVGYAQGTVKNCSVSNVTLKATPDSLTGSYDNGDKVGGIVAVCNGAVAITNCTVSGENSLTGYRDIGGLVGSLGSGSTVEGNTVEGEITIVVDQTTGYYGDKDANAAAVVGRDNGVTVSEENTVTAVESILTQLDGAGTETDPFTIATAEELVNFAKIVNAGNTYDNAYVKVTANIDLADVDWTPIGTAENGFMGTFDGGEKVISNLNVTGTTNVGLFGVVTGGAVVKNVTLDNVSVTGVNQVGALAGNLHVSTAENCHVTGTVVVAGNYKVGGLVGTAYATITNCSVEGSGTVTGIYTEVADREGDCVGGILGFQGECTRIVSDCSVSGITVTGTRKVGGIVGSAFQDNSYNGCSVSNVTVATNATETYATGKASSMGIGGIVGLYTAHGTPGTLKDSVVENLTLSDGGVTATLGYITGGLRGTSVPTAPAVEYSNNVVEGLTSENAVYGTYCVAVNLIVTVGEGKDYATIEEAAAAINASNAELATIEVYNDVTMNAGVVFTTVNNVTVKGVGEDVTITLENNLNDNDYSNPFEIPNSPTGFSISKDQYGVPAGSEFAIENLTFVNNKTMDHYTGGHNWRAAYHTYAYAENVTYTDVNFDGGVSVCANVTFDNCTFTEDNSQMYCLFIDQEYSDEDEAYDVVITNCTFAPADTAYGAAKIANADGKITLEVTDSTFIAVPNKAAINADTNVTATVTGNEFINCVNGAYKGDSGKVNGVDVTDKTALATEIAESNTVQSSLITAKTIDAVAGEETATMRFITEATKIGGEVSAYGTYIIPVRIFDDWSAVVTFGSYDAEENAIAEGDTYAVDLAGIPADYYDDAILARSFMIVDGNTVYCTFSAASVNEVK